MWPVTCCVSLSRYPESLFKPFLAVSGPYVGKATNIALEAAARPRLHCCLLTKARSSMPLGVVAVVSDTLFSELYVMRVLSFYFSQLTAKVRPHEHCIPASR